MNQRNLIIVIGLILAVLAVGWLVWSSRMQPPPTATSNEHTKANTLSNSRQPEAGGNTVEIPGVGKLRFKSVDRDFSSGEWMRRINHALEPNDRQSEEDFAWRDKNNAWNEIDVYQGEHGEILHMEIHKGLFDTYPMDKMAIAALQNQWGLSIVRIGYPDGLLESGYSADDFIRATMEHWDFGASYGGEGKPYEIEITPVIVRISTLASMPYPQDPSFLGREIPMVLVKQGSYIERSEAPIITETKMDGFSYEESIRRTWSLQPYVPIEWNGQTILPPIGTGVPFNEPLMEAWNRREAAAGETRK